MYLFVSFSLLGTLVCFVQLLPESRHPEMPCGTPIGDAASQKALHSGFAGAPHIPEEQA